MWNSNEIFTALHSSAQLPKFLVYFTDIKTIFFTVYWFDYSAVFDIKCIISNYKDTYYSIDTKYGEEYIPYLLNFIIMEYEHYGDK